VGKPPAPRIKAACSLGGLGHEGEEGSKKKTREKREGEPERLGENPSKKAKSRVVGPSLRKKQKTRTTTDKNSFRQKGRLNYGEMHLDVHIHKKKPKQKAQSSVRGGTMPNSGRARCRLSDHGETGDRPFSRSAGRKSRVKV